MEIAFRVDASNRIGTGHVVRCLTLAEQLRARGAECRFITRAHPGHMAEAIRSRGFPVTELPAPSMPADEIPDGDYAQWLGVATETDAAETLEALEGRPDWLVVDHYALDATWTSRLRPHVGGIAVLDDLANRRHDCDLLLDQNAIAEPEARYDGLLPETAQRLCGPRYAILRPEYAAARRLIGPRRGPLSRVLVFYGGADTQNETGRALRVLSRPPFTHLAVDVVIGANNAHREALLEQAQARPRTTVYGPRPHLVDLMLEADLALGGGGTTTWERCAVGLPSVVTAVAENQVPFNEHLAAEGAIAYLGLWSRVDDEQLAETLQGLLDDEDRLAAMAQRAWRITDGLGCLRAAEALLPTPAEKLQLREAEPADKALFFEWAKDPQTRRHAHQSEPIPWATHNAWFDARLADPNTHLWVLETPQGLPVGQARIEVQADRAVLDYSIDPAFRGRGWGHQVLQRAASAWRVGADSRPLTGEVRPGNTASQRAFLRAGFIEHDQGGGHRLYADRPLGCRELAQ